MIGNKEILLHCCCGPCSTICIKRLIDMNWSVTLFYNNSNIFPFSENEKRFQNLLKVSDLYNVKVVHGSYDHNAWREFVKGFENEPEHGKRCLLCYEYNLREAYNTALNLNISYFTTTLTVSRFKKSTQIFSVGDYFSGFQRIDFKKKDGFAESTRMSKEMGLYRQQYCGCEFSISEKV